MLLPNSYTYMPLPSVFQEVQDCRLPGLKPSKRFRRPPRQQLLQLLHAPAICFSGGSRLPFARPQTPQTLPTLPQASKATTLTATCPCHLFFRGFKTAVCPPQTPQTLPTLPQASKATTLTATTCPCHLFFRGFKTAVCPPSNPPNASNPSAGLQGNNSYSYMPLPSVFQGVQDCRLPALKPPKPFRRPPRQQLLQLHAPAICFSGGSRLPFARPQTPQTLPTLPQASKATTLKATCPCHLFFRGFKTAVCPASNPPNASNPSAGLQGNNSYSYMPLPSVFQGVQDCRLPALKPPQTLPTLPQASKATTLTATCPCHLFFRGFKTAVCPPSNPPNASNPPAGLQGNNSYSYYMPLPSVFQGVQDCRLPALKRPKRFQPFRRPPRQQLLQLHAPAICFSGGSRLPFARPQTPQTLPQASKATTLTATCPCHLFFRGFKTAVCPASNPPNASNPPAGLQGNNSYSYMPLPSVFQEVQDCRLPGLKPSKRFRRPPRQQLLQLHAPAICFSGGSRLPFARPQTPQTLPTLPQASKATTLTATCPCHLFFRGFKTAVCPASNPPNASNPSAGLQGNNSYSYMPLPSVFQGVQDCRLPALKPPNPSGNNSYSYMPLPSVFQGVQDCRLPALKPPKPFRRPPTTYMPLPSVFQEVQDCRLPGLKTSKRFRRPPRQQLLQLLHAQQLLQLHAPAICFSGSSRLPFARPQTPQTLPTLPQASKATTLTATCPCHLFFRGFKTAVCPPQTPQTLPTLSQASKATTLTATTCPCHLFFRGFKTAVCPPSNPPNASNPSAGLQGNNSYSYMPLPSVFQGVQDRPPRQQLLQLHAPAICFSGGSRLPFARPQTPKPFRRPPRQQLLQLHVPAICFSGGSRLPFARPQTPQTLPQASKATTLTATCPCHLFFRGFKTAVCPPSNPPNPSAGLQGNNSYSYMPLPSVFQGVQDCRLPALNPPKRFQPSRRPPRHLFFTTLTATTCPCHLFFRGFKTAVCPASNPPNASNPLAGLQGNNSYSYMPLPSVFQGVQDCRLPALKPPKRFRRPPRQQLLQLHAPAICFSGGSRLPFARPQSPQTLPQASKATLLQLHAPAICFSGGSRLPFARPQTPQTLPTLSQASKATTLTATCPCHLFFRGFKTAVCPPSNPPNTSNPPAGLQGNNSDS